ncbi:MAG: acyl-CoA dehydrogenase family protein [Myxococcales bacterium]|nr:acyl-CoA dehydrogenase family protein [Myxococcales bacterium]MCB9576064.1 acyl-CoA dehydrogenase family protein [Polyangiaceae bacterium]
MTDDIERGRNDLIAWEGGKPDNVFTWDENLGKILSLRLGAERFGEERARLERTGAMVATRLRPLTEDTNHDDYLPRLERFNGVGERTEEIVFHPSYHEAGRLVWDTGVLADYATPGKETLQMGILYMLGAHGEYGHQCPLACTAGLIKVVQRLGTEAQKKKWLPGLLTRDYDKRIHASQFLTEVQGGSDVGANAVVARKDGDHWRLSGEKWFCSVIDAQLFLMTARPEGAPAGTRGLGLFVTPRMVNGSVNEFNVRRLKRKLGTRAMASGETDFLGAHAEAVGPLDRGFKNVVEIVLNTSRVFNAVCCAGSMIGAYREAASYARYRRAFGQTIDNYPLVQDALATLRAEAYAATASSLRLAAMADRFATHSSTEEEKLAWRVGVNVNKYWTAIRNTQSVRTAIEVLGGNGVIETFTPLVQLYRDALVLESWEGTHNVLVQQVLKDASRYAAHTAFIAELRESLKKLSLPAEHAPLLERAGSGLSALERGFEKLAGGQGDQRFGRALVDQAAVCLEVVAMLEELAATPEDTVKRAAIELVSQRFLLDEVPLPAAIPAALLS